MEAPNEFQLEAVAVANKLEDAMVGHSTVACLAAISMVIGAFAAAGEQQNFDRLMALITQTAREEFDRRAGAAGNDN